MLHASPAALAAWPPLGAAVDAALEQVELVLRAAEVNQPADLVHVAGDVELAVVSPSRFPRRRSVARRLAQSRRPLGAPARRGPRNAHARADRTQPSARHRPLPPSRRAFRRRPRPAQTHPTHRHRRGRSATAPPTPARRARLARPGALRRPVARLGVALGVRARRRADAPRCVSVRAVCERGRSGLLAQVCTASSPSRTRSLSPSPLASTPSRRTHAPAASAAPTPPLTPRAQPPAPRAPLSPSAVARAARTRRRRTRRTRRTHRRRRPRGGASGGFLGGFGADHAEGGLLPHARARRHLGGRRPTERRDGPRREKEGRGSHAF